MMLAMTVAYPPLSPRTRRRVRALTAVVLIGVTVAALVLRPDGSGARAHADGTAATVTSVTVGPCTDTAPEAGVRCTRVSVHLRGREVTLDETAADPVVHAGDAVVVDVATSR